MGSITVDNVYVTGVLILDRIEVTSGDLDSEGVFEIDIEDAVKSGSDFYLENGLVLKGIRVLSNGEALILDDLKQIFLIVSSMGVSSLVHNSVDVSDTNRLPTSSGLDVWVDSRRIQVFWSKRSGSWKWEVPDWS